MLVEQLLITGAAREMLADDLITFAETMKVWDTWHYDFDMQTLLI
jgi:hypothetical protein